jgi:hypothetical protein
MLLDDNGTKDYLVLNLDSSEESGTFYWTTDIREARENAISNYPKTEGMDRRGSELIFICKGIRMMYTLQLDEGTFRRSSTVSGLFEGEPDQIQRLTHSPTDLLCFTEDDSRRSGVHARDASARFFTILESRILPGETTGLSFSPDGRFMYVAYQGVRALFCIWRRDGKAFGGDHVDVKYHDEV